MAELGQAGIQPTGVPLTVIHEVIDEETNGDIELCIPIADTFAGGEDTYSRELEGGSVAATVHHGRFQEVAPAYHTLTGWISENGHEIVGSPREIYLTDPRTVAPDDLRTRVEFPIRLAEAD